MKSLKRLFLLILVLSFQANKVFCQNWQTENRELVWQKSFDSDLDVISDLKTYLITKFKSHPNFIIQSESDTMILVNFGSLRFHYAEYGYVNTTPILISQGSHEGVVIIELKNKTYHVAVRNILSNYYFKKHYPASYGTGGTPNISTWENEDIVWNERFFNRKDLVRSKYELVLKLADFNFNDLFMFNE